MCHSSPARHRKPRTTAGPAIGAGILTHIDGYDTDAAAQPALPPILLGWLDRAAELVRVWCPHCRRYHIHGAPGGEMAQHEHRAAHCCDHRRRGRSPYHATGYLICLDHGCPPPRRLPRR